MSRVYCVSAMRDNSLDLILLLKGRQASRSCFACGPSAVLALPHTHITIYTICHYPFSKYVILITVCRVGGPGGGRWASA